MVGWGADSLPIYLSEKNEKRSLSELQIVSLGVRKASVGIGNDTDFH